MATVLIVDDEPGVREGLVRAVGGKGHRTVAASSLAEARRRWGARNSTACCSTYG